MHEALDFLNKRRILTKIYYSLFTFSMFFFQIFIMIFSGYIIYIIWDNPYVTIFFGLLFLCLSIALDIFFIRPKVSSYFCNLSVRNFKRWLYDNSSVQLLTCNFTILTATDFDIKEYLYSLADRPPAMGCHVLITAVLYDKKNKTLFTYSGRIHKFNRINISYGIIIHQEENEVTIYPLSADQIMEYPGPSYNRFKFYDQAEATFFKTEIESLLNENNIFAENI